MARRRTPGRWQAGRVACLCWCGRRVGYIDRALIGRSTFSCGKDCTPDAALDAEEAVA